MNLIDEAFRHLQDGDLEQAVELFSQALSHVPDSAQAYRGRGMARLQLKAFKQAQVDFRQARAIDPNDLDSWIGLGMSLAMDHQIYPAIDEFEALLAQHPRHAKAHLQLGLLYYRLCIPRKGKEQLDLALASRPTLAERKLIEQTLAEQQKLDKNRYQRPDFEALRREQSES